MVVSATFNQATVTALRSFDRDMQLLARDFGKRGGFRQPLTESVNNVIIPAIRRNFVQEGYPIPWAQIGPDSYRRSKKRVDAPILQVTRKMYNAAIAKARFTIRDNVITYGDWPSRAWYGPVQDLKELSDRAGILNHRPFAVLAEEDIEGIGIEFSDWIRARARARGW